MSRESPEPTRGVSISTGILIGVVVVVVLVLAGAVYFGVPWGEDAAPEGIDPDNNDDAPASQRFMPPAAGYLLITADGGAIGGAYGL